MHRTSGLHWTRRMLSVCILSATGAAPVRPGVDMAEELSTGEILSSSIFSSS